MNRIEKLKEYMKTAETDSFLQHALALEYIKVGNDEEARLLFNMILKREPTYLGSYYHLGKTLEKLGDFEKALRVYKRGMEVAEEQEDAHAYRELDAAHEDAEDAYEDLKDEE